MKEFKSTAAENFNVQRTKSEATKSIKKLYTEKYFIKDIFY